MLVTQKAAHIKVISEFHDSMNWKNCRSFWKLQIWSKNSDFRWENLTFQYCSHLNFAAHWRRAKNNWNVQTYSVTYDVKSNSGWVYCRRPDLPVQMRHRENSLRHQIFPCTISRRFTRRKRLNDGWRIHDYGLGDENIWQSKFDANFKLI